MKICTITCHDVYNHGASLQAYGLLKYLTDCGHDVEIIDYKPDYLSNHYKLFHISNPKWERNLATKTVYVTAKLPERIFSLRRKKAFDRFKAKYLRVTKTRYRSNDELKSNVPHADAYLCGSDQIWNSLHRNGRDPAFYLDFVPEQRIKASYAASFATDSIADEYKPKVKAWVERLDGVAVREKSGVSILHSLDIARATGVVDPVFLLGPEAWNQLGADEVQEKYIVVYDFDRSELIRRIALDISKTTGWKIYALHADQNGYADKTFESAGPGTFVSLVRNAQVVISNSFHAAVFSIIYEKQFVIVNRKEAINTRMRDLLDDLKLSHRLVDERYNVQMLLSKIDYTESKRILQGKIRASKLYLRDILAIRKRETVGNPS